MKPFHAPYQLLDARFKLKPVLFKAGNHRIRAELVLNLIKRPDDALGTG